MQKDGSTPRPLYTCACGANGLTYILGTDMTWVRFPAGARNN